MAGIPAEIQKQISDDPIEQALKGQPAKAEPTLVSVREVEKPNLEKPIKKEIPVASPAATVTTVPAVKVEETPLTTENKADLPDFDKLLSEKFNGRFKTAADIEKYVSDYEKINGEYANSQKKIKSLEERNPFANDYLKKANDYVAQGGDIDTFHRVMRVDPDKLTAEQKLSVQLQWQKGIDPAKADKLVAYKYKLGDGYTDEDGNLSSDAEMARLQMEVDATDADKFLRDTIKQELTPPDVSAEIETRMAQWTPVMPSVKDNHNVIAFKGKDDVSFDFNVPKETLDSIEAEMNDILRSPQFGMLPDKEGQVWASDYMKGEILKKHFPEILNGVINKMKIEHVKDKHNPSVLAEITPKQENGMSVEQINSMLQD